MALNTVLNSVDAYKENLAQPLTANDNVMYVLQNVEFSNLIDTSNLFRGLGISAAPEFDTSNVKKAQYMFGNCSNLTEIPAYDLGGISAKDGLQYFMQNCNNVTAINAYNIAADFELPFTSTAVWNHDKIMDFARNNLVQGISSSSGTAYYSKLSLSPPLYYTITTADKQELSAKGWTVPNPYG